MFGSEKSNVEIVPSYFSPVCFQARLLISKDRELTPSP